MAEWAAKGERTKSCEDCDKMASQASGHFARGVQVRIFEVYDCKKCEVYLSQPSQDNENIVFLYEALPKNFDGYSGAKTISAKDIQFLFLLYEVPEDIWFDYYHRLMFFHDQLISASQKQIEIASKKAPKGWLKKPFSRKGGRMRRQ